jgi:hypothetical protein
MTLIPNLQSSLPEDPPHIWDSLAKLDGLVDVRLEDYCDVAFEALPHKVSSPRIARISSLILTSSLGFSPLVISRRQRPGY